MRNKRKEKTGIEIRVLRQEDPDYPPAAARHTGATALPFTLSAISDFETKNAGGGRLPASAGEHGKRVAMQIGKAYRAEPGHAGQRHGKGIDSFAHLELARWRQDHRGAWSRVDIC